ncbi:MAG: bifunctional 2-polyprenyl-6-hydroxyphenol methylase/3-demethylubiquinol 3-O-methyltransferase UbiG [Rickettsiales endosymbiont of Dermacentor nuttalli]
MSTVDPKEVQKFTNIATEWWNPHGKFKPLHMLNPVRIQYIKDKIISHFNIIPKDYSPLNRLKLLDVGCGGGLISEPMSRLGATVTAIDASSINIKIAKQHSLNSKLNINYLCNTTEDLVSSEQKFDIILALEVIEHISNIEDFIKSCSHLLNNSGIIFMSTLNRTITSFLQSIIAAEYILRWLPVGTHNWNKFVLPSELSKYLRQNNLNIKEIKGIKFHPITQRWTLSEDISNNYITYIC